MSERFPDLKMSTLKDKQLAKIKVKETKKTVKVKKESKKVEPLKAKKKRK